VVLLRLSRCSRRLERRLGWMASAYLLDIVSERHGNRDIRILL
jgi:hypothetical protein